METIASDYQKDLKREQPITNKKKEGSMMFKFNKRAIASVLTLAMAVVTLAGCSGGASKTPSGTSENSKKPEVVYRINSTQAVDLFEQLEKKFAENVTEMSGGRIGFEFVPTGSIGSSTEALTSVQMGTLDFVNGGSDELGSLVPNSDWAQLPFFINSHEQADKEYMNGFIGKFADEQYAEKGLVSVVRVDNSFRTLGIKDKAVNSSNDLKGLRIRVPNQPLALRMYELMGALPVAIPAPEVLMALQQGTVDGADNAVLLFDKFKLMDSFKSVVLLNYGFGTVNIFASKEIWDTMSAEDQKIMKEAGLKAREWYTAELLKQEKELIERLKAEGKNVIVPDDKWKAEMYKNADVIWQEALKSGKYDETFIKELYALYQKNIGAK
ncbi:TRAP transporter substrate-binding protein [Desulfosporosinus sp.]|uniref:TRAP transporter substrate-binding protein n=1 Tax=Desulfosporosinus sp. TaxID=157907 RepID=UPI0025C1DD08|nr:TRAP transporter substrate-binding protein DctP [Desulfosporosinus sp.]MBC2722135.1 TRAP transporter substrate-binding protein DctP [Desulfosporosinus sp.]MBC2726496.1 TRAP transporter substrate-binding protein DctP [Desulfosporosinus sp.]